MTMTRAAIRIAVVLAVCACTAAASARPVPPAPDYSKPNAWLALPDSQSMMRQVPPDSGFSDLEDRAPVDVFYLLPTTSQGNAQAEPNQRYDLPDALAFARMVGANQAGTFNATARIYAPMYRAIKNDLWGAPLDTVQGPLEIAWHDAKAAFDYYIARYNQGRPFIIVAHSQGDVFAYRLIQEELDGTPLGDRLVAAYIVGQPLPATFFDDYRRIKSCQGATDTRCIIGWQTHSKGLSEKIVERWAYDQYYWIARERRYGAPRPPFYVSMNPIAWTNDPSVVSPRSDNLGSIRFHPVYPPPAHYRLEPLIPGAAGAQAGPAATWVTPASFPLSDYSIQFKPNPPTVAQGVLHFYDFSLFWVNVRLNARDRANAYLADVRRARYPLITSPILAKTRAGSGFRFAVTTKNAATRFSASGLPAGLSINAQTGAVTGTASKPGVYAVVITASNGAGASVGELALTVVRSSR